MTREQKITLGEMRASGVRRLLIHCSDYKCSHWMRISVRSGTAVHLQGVRQDGLV
jgi:hypothetical protein